MEKQVLYTVDQAAVEAWNLHGFKITGDELWAQIEAGTGPVLASWRPRASELKRSWGRIAYGDLRDWIRHQRAILIRDAAVKHAWAKDYAADADKRDPIEGGDDEGTRIKLSGRIGGFQD